MLRTAVVLSIALTWAGPGLAQESGVLLTEAQQRFQEGLQLHDQGRDEQAFAKFMQAYAIVRSPAVLFNLARTEQLTGRLLEARDHFQQYIELPSDTPRVTPELRQQARDFLAEVRARLGRIAVTATQGATISVDGRLLEERAPLRAPVEVVPGRHTIEASLGSRSERVSLSVDEGRAQSVTLDLAPHGIEAPPPAPPAPAAPPASAVPPAPAPGPAPAPAPGPAPATHEGGWSTRQWLGLVVGVAALGAAGTGLGFELSAQGDAAQAANLSAQLPPGSSICVQTTNASCQPLYDANHSAQDKRNIALPLLIGGAALAAAAVTIFAWPGGGEETKTTLGASPSGLLLKGRF